MPCEPIRMDYGTTVLAMVKPGSKLTENDRKIIAEYAQFCRDRRDLEQRKKNLKVNGVKR